MEPIATTLLLGIDYARYGELAVAEQGARTACAISVGGEGMTPAQLFKGSSEVPNEDALCALDHGPRTLLAVADAHYGHLASHVLLSRLAADLTGESVTESEAAAEEAAAGGEAGSAREAKLPSNVLELFELVLGLGDEARGEALAPEEEFDWAREAASDAAPAWGAPPPDESETTLLVAVVDRDKGRVFGLCYGDSSLLVLGDPSREAAVRHSRRELYVTPRASASLHPSRAVEFDFALPESGLVLAFTDGVDECCYREPRCSVQAADIAQLAAEQGFDPAQVAPALAELALTGVRGYPGGQDNLAIAVTRV